MVCESGFQYATLTLKAKNHTEKGVVFAVVQFIDSLMQALKACFLLP